MERTHQRRWPSVGTWPIAVVLALTSIALYWPALHFRFINFDDDLYVTANLTVQSGLSWATVKWAFANPVASNWHPLTVLTHALDCQLFGLQPWGHHLTNVLLHAASTAMVFLFLRRLTGARWPSAAVAALFGWHPLHVESVAWIAERKDVLSALFGAAALLCYVRFAQKRAPAAIDGSTTTITRGHGWLDYGATFVFLALGLMSKPMLVTWPFIMLLLDWWPLRRLANGQARSWFFRIVLEKTPFLALAAAASVVTFVVQSRTAALVRIDRLPLAARTENAMLSLCRYLGELVWPSRLAVFYPHPGLYPLWQVLLAAGLLVAITSTFVVLRHHRPHLLFGWLWFFGMLVPVLGLVQAGDQAMADRYTYLPSIGVFLAATWELKALTERWRWRAAVPWAVAVLVLCLCLATTRRQLPYWANSETLFRHALAVTNNNHLAHNNLGAALNDRTQIDEALREFEEAVRLRPSYAKAHGNLGSAFLKKGRIGDAILELREALKWAPDSAQAHKNLGIALHRQGRPDEAVAELQQAIRLKPDFTEARYNLGTILLGQGRPAEAASQFREVVEQRSDWAEARNNLGIALGMQGQTDAAVAEFRQALRLKPDYVQAQRNLAHLVSSP